MSDDDYFIDVSGRKWFLVNPPPLRVVESQSKEHRGVAMPDPTKKPNGTTCAVCGKFWEFKFDMRGKPLPVKCDHHKTP